MPLTEDFTYMLDDTGVVLNTSADLPPFVDVLKASGFDSAEIRLSQRDHEGTDGGFVDAEFEKSRTLTLEGVAYGGVNTLEPYLDRLKANWGPSSTVIPLYYKLPGVAERVYFVKPLGCRYDYEELRRIGSTAIQFMCIAEDPRAYDAQLKTVNVLQGDTIVTGRGYPRGYLRGYGATVVPIGSSVFVSGNRPTPPTITIPGPCLNFQVINDTTGDVMIFDVNLLAGETMTIDMKYHSITVNGQNRRATLREPNWFFLRPGENYLRFRAVSSNNTSMTVNYRSAWR